jgi:hypothetical protein
MKVLLFRLFYRLSDAEFYLKTVLTWVSIYWFSAAGPGASLRIYYEMVKAGDRVPDVTTTPMGFSHFPKELFNVPRL